MLCSIIGHKLNVCIVYDAKVMNVNGIAKRGCLNMRNSLKRCFTTHSKSLNFRGALSCKSDSERRAWWMRGGCPWACRSPRRARSSTMWPNGSTSAPSGNSSVHCGTPTPRRCAHRRREASTRTRHGPSAPDLMPYRPYPDKVPV